MGHCLSLFTFSFQTERFHWPCPWKLKNKILFRMQRSGLSTITTIYKILHFAYFAHLLGLSTMLCLDLFAEDQ